VTFSTALAMRKRSFKRSMLYRRFRPASQVFISKLKAAQTRSSKETVWVRVV